MDQLSLFATALGLSAPWYVSETTLPVEDKRLDIKIDFARGSCFACPLRRHRGQGLRHDR